MTIQFKMITTAVFRINLKLLNLSIVNFKEGNLRTMIGI